MDKARHHGVLTQFAVAGHADLDDSGRPVAGTHARLLPRAFSAGEASRFAYEPAALSTTNGLNRNARLQCGHSEANCGFCHASPGRFTHGGCSVFSPAVRVMPGRASSTFADG